MTSLLKSYSKADEASQVARQKTRKRLAILALSSVFLVAIIVAAVVGVVSQGSDSKPDSGSSGPPSPSTSIKAVCSTTLYPTSCFKALSPMVNSTTMDPEKLLQLSIQVAMDGVAKAAKRLDGMGAGQALDKMSSAALDNCKELLGLALDQLNDTMAPADLTSAEVVDNLKTWLSSAITYFHTCVDGFDEGGYVEMKNKVAQSLNSSTELTSNSLAILTAFSSFADSLGLRRRRLMSYEMPSSPQEDQYPSWLPPSSRRLLESSDDPRSKANIVVAKNGTGNYTTVAAAVAAVPSKSKERFIIYVTKGVYRENVKLDKNKWNVMMVGDGMDATIISGSLNFVDGTPTYSTATFAVMGKYFVAQDIGFRNTAGAIKQQAVALMSSSDQSVFYRCRFDAYQDTLYANSLRQFYRECKIYGTIDFIFGNAVSVFQNCNIFLRPPLPGQQDTITAQGKVDPNQNTGISIHNCTIWPSGKMTSVKVYLGRPWKPYSTTVFMKTMMPKIIDPAGWLPWTGTTAPDTIFYGEYQNTGPGAVTTNRVKWTGLKFLTANEAKNFTVGSFLGGSWIGKTSVPYSSRL